MVLLVAVGVDAAEELEEVLLGVRLVAVVPPPPPPLLLLRLPLVVVVVYQRRH